MHDGDIGVPHVPGYRPVLGGDVGVPLLLLAASLVSNQIYTIRVVKAVYFYNYANLKLREFCFSF